jgi:anti-sigma regulatory factor (Ser/Thr protein kinase)
VSWSLRFAEPIVLTDGSNLATLREAVAHLGKTVSKGERDLPAVMMAAELLTNAAEHGGRTEFGRIATLQAINRNVERVFDPTRKDHDWGRRKLARDR